MTPEDLEDRWAREWKSMGRITPDYGGYSVAGVPAAIRKKYGMKPASNGTEEFVLSASGGGTLLIVLDGLGYCEMKRNRTELPFFNRCLKEGHILPVTTVFPSTTSAAITTLHTGKLPGEHGVIEWYLYLRELGMLVESLPFTPRLPEDNAAFNRLRPSVKMLYRGRTIYSKLSTEGISSLIMQPEGIADSAFSRLVSRGGERAGYTNLEDALQKLGRRLETGKHRLIHFYYPGIDSAGHAYGPSSPQYLEEMRRVDSFLARAGRLAAEKGFALVVTADHGHVDVQPKDMILLDDIHGFAGRLDSRNGKPIQPYGSPRDVIIATVEEGRQFSDWLSGQLGDRAEVLTSEQLVREGYFGRSISRIGRERISDVWVLPNGENTVWYRHFRDETFVFKGMHGGASLNEMIVPLLVI